MRRDDGGTGRTVDVLDDAREDEAVDEPEGYEEGAGAVLGVVVGVQDAAEEADRLPLELAEDNLRAARLQCKSRLQLEP